MTCTLEDKRHRDIKARILSGLISCLAAIFSGPLPAAEAAPDISGTWVPVSSLSQPWDTASLPLTASAKDALAAFDPARQDSSAFCMPFGTPRNMLNTAPDPFEILVTDHQITFIFDRLGDVRRISTDGRPFPEDPIPSWMGYSIGSWQGSTLHVDTIAMNAESILADSGLPHSESLTLSEEITLMDSEIGLLLIDDMTLTDPENFRTPIRAIRYFQRAPYATMSEGSSLCLLDMWRERLENTNREMFRELQAQEAGQ